MARYTYREETGHEQAMRSRKLATARREAEEILRGGEWGQGAADFTGCTVEAEILDANSNDRFRDLAHVAVDILPPEPSCAGRRGHEWVATVKIDGGCSDNPGVMSLGGTAMEFRTHCERCGLRRVEVTSGCQRNAGQARHTVRYLSVEGE